MRRLFQTQMRTLILVALVACTALSLVFAGTKGQKGRLVSAKPEPVGKPAEMPVPFRAGETLDYRVLWSSFSVNAASVRMSVAERRAFYGREAWHFQALAHTTAAMRLIFTLDDQFDSYTEPRALVSLQYEMYLREQGKKEDLIFRMSAEGDPAPGSGPAVRVLPETRDPLGLLFYLRAVDWGRNKLMRCPVFDGKKLYEGRAHLALERGQVSVPAGTFTAARIDVRVYERGKELDQTGFSVWLAHDPRRTPVLLEAQVPLGSARVELVHAGK